MATTLESNLYPPIMDTYMPTFDKDSGCKVYFTLSNYNSINDINSYAQVSVKYQHSNQTALSKTIYPLELAFKNIHMDENGYFIYITKNDLDKEEFCTNNYYKVQIRFMSLNVPTQDIVTNSATEITTVPNEMKKSSWLNKYLGNFSEWSKVCLIKGIEKPNFSFTYLDADSSKEVVLSDTTFTQIVGSMSFDSVEEKEYLKTYDIKVYLKNDIANHTDDSGVIHWEDFSPVYSSGEIHPEETNSRAINHNILYMFDNNSHYIIYFHYITNNDYEDTFIMRFYTSNLYDNKIEADFKCELEEDDARMRIELDISDDYFDVMNPIFNDSQGRLGGIVFRRSSSKDNFKYWEDIRIINANDLIRFRKGGVTYYKFYDYTIEAGVLYQYGVQAYNGKGQRTPIRIYSEEALSDGVWMCDMDDMFLTDKNRQLKIKFNPQINSFSRTLMEGKTDTIGSKYPFFYRNGIVNYKTFPISGLISQAMDENYVFFNKEDFDMNIIKEKIGEDSMGHPIYAEDDLNRKAIYGEYYNLYKDFNKNMNISDDRDYIFERYFREAVMDFLYDGKVKLFRSSTEGNILVRLMNITLTPNQQLGRLVYSFNATAYEVDECNFNNYINYDIHEIDNPNNNYDSFSTTDSSLVRIGELDFVIGEGKDSLKTLLMNKYNRKNIPFYKKGEFVANYDYSVNSIDWVKIYFPGTDGPIGHGGVEQTLLIKEEEGNLKIIEDDAEIDNHTMLGFVIRVNGSQVLVSRLGVYTIVDPKVPISDIVFSDMNGYNINVRIEYRVILNRSYAETLEEKLTKYYFSLGTGQIWNKLSPNQNIVKMIMNKYQQESATLKQELTAVKKITVESEPQVVFAVNGANVTVKNGTLLDIQGGTTTYLNKSGQLEIVNGSDALWDAYFAGYKLIKNTSIVTPLNLRPNEYYLKKGEFNEQQLKESKDYQANMVYYVGQDEETKEDRYIIYFRDDWYNFDIQNEVVLKPVTAMINYIYELRRGSL